VYCPSKKPKYEIAYLLREISGVCGRDFKWMFVIHVNWVRFALWDEFWKKDWVIYDDIGYEGTVLIYGGVCV
jgi:hypothetical protein